MRFNPADNFQLKRQSRPLPGLVDIETVNQILDQPAPETEAQQQMWLRDKAILELLYSSGLRLAEVQSLRIKDVDFNRQLLRITGKGNKTRIVPFGAKAKEAVMNWLQVYPLWHGDFVPEANVFITQKGNPLGARQIENRVKFQAQRAGVNVDLHPHLLRHCFASHMLSNSGDLRAVHHLAKVYDQAHPRAAKK